MGNASSRGFAQGQPTCAPPAQTLEVRTNGVANPLKQYPPSPDGYGGTGVTAVVDGSDGDVVERYAYDPYGKVTVLDGEDDADGGVSDWSADADNVSDWDNRIGYCGYRLDPETGADGQGIMHVRHRPYIPPLGRWGSRDPLNQDQPGGRYHDGMNLYEYVRSDPVDYIDRDGAAADVAIAMAVANALNEVTWTYSHKRGPQLLDDKLPSYKMWIWINLPAKAFQPNGAAQAWQVNEWEYTALTSKCEWKSDSGTIIDIVNIGARRRIQDTLGWGLRRGEYCLAYRTVSKRIGFNAAKQKFRQCSLTSPDAASVAKAKAMRGPIGVLEYTYLYLNKANCKCCPKLLKTIAYDLLPDGEYLQLPGVGGYVGGGKWPTPK